MDPGASVKDLGSSTKVPSPTSMDTSSVLMDPSTDVEVSSLALIDPSKRQHPKPNLNGPKTQVRVSGTRLGMPRSRNGHRGPRPDLDGHGPKRLGSEH